MSNEVIKYCEQHGIYEVYKVVGNVITYYSYFGNEGFYKVTHNIVTGEETRNHLKCKKAPKFLFTENGATKYNYFCG